MTTTYYSHLWRAWNLSGNSQVFGLLVQAAAAHEGVPYSEELKNWVATRPDVLEHIVITDEQSADDVLTAFATNPDTAPLMDQVITNAVRARVALENNV